jgi:hypothetical protein
VSDAVYEEALRLAAGVERQLAELVRARAIAEQPTTLALYWEAFKESVEEIELPGDPVMDGVLVELLPGSAEARGLKLERTIVPEIAGQGDDEGYAITTRWSINCVKPSEPYEHVSYDADLLNETGDNGPEQPQAFSGLVQAVEAGPIGQLLALRAVLEGMDVEVL